MKKLMIAAAAAAMIGGVEAAGTNVYQFVANLQTTTGAIAAGYDTYANDYAAFGKSSTGAWWYNDSEIDDLVTKDGSKYEWNFAATLAGYDKDLTWYQHSLDGITVVPALAVKSANGVIAASTANWLKGISAKYQVKSAGVWCCELAWTIKTTIEGSCYRVAGANYINEQIQYVEDCCADRYARFTLTDGTTSVIEYDGTRSTYFTHRFGASTADQATCLELYAGVQNLRTAIANLRFTGVLAGQGYWQLINNKRAPIQICGSIVGYTDPSICEFCCADPINTDAFDCLDASTAVKYLNTAAYGTFYLQYIGSK